MPTNFKELRHKLRSEARSRSGNAKYKAKMQADINKAHYDVIRLIVSQASQVIRIRTGRANGGWTIGVGRPPAVTTEHENWGNPSSYDYYPFKRHDHRSVSGRFKRALTHVLAMTKPQKIYLCNHTYYLFDKPISEAQIQTILSNITAKKWKGFKVSSRGSM